MNARSDNLEPRKRRRPAARAASADDNGVKAQSPDGATKPASAAQPSRVANAPRRVSSKRATTARAATPDAESAGEAGRVSTRARKTKAHAQEPAVEPSKDAAQQYDMERDLAGLLRDVEGAHGNAEARQRAADAISSIAARLQPSARDSQPPDETLLGGARELFSADYYVRRLGRLGLRGRSEQVDDFGLDPAYEARVQPLLDALYARYFRVSLTGAANIPTDGPALLVCNHSGTLPWDGVMLKTALRHARPRRRGLRWLIDDFVFHSPFLGSFLNRIGAVRACQENAERLLARGELLAVFPEGVKGIGKPWGERYKLERFGRGGHIKLALRSSVPVLPLAIVGAEETYPLLYKLRVFSKLLGVPFIPITPLFPWLGPLGLVPLPSRWHIAVGEPMRELERLGKDAAEDSVLVNEHNGRLRAKVQSLVDQARSLRGPAFF
jgi:1-acyl-sn-glycerol-3-phosphate acyltransferase